MRSISFTRALTAASESWVTVAPAATIALVASAMAQSLSRPWAAAGVAMIADSAPATRSFFSMVVPLLDFSPDAFCDPGEDTDVELEIVAVHAVVEDHVTRDQQFALAAVADRDGRELGRVLLHGGIDRHIGREREAGLHRSPAAALGSSRGAGGMVADPPADAELHAARRHRGDVGRAVGADVLAHDAGA